MNEKMKKKIAVGSDHGGFELKNAILEPLTEEGYDINDLGTFTPEAADYPDIALGLANAVAAGEYDLGILICGTGIGISIAANKVKGIRAAACSDVFTARMSRAHNDANILCIGGRVVGPGLGLELVKTFIDTEFEAGGRHERRVSKICNMESC